MCDACRNLAVEFERTLTPSQREGFEKFLAVRDEEDQKEADATAIDEAVDEADRAYREVHEQIGPIVGHLRDTADKVKFLVGEQAPIFKELEAILGMIGSLPPTLPR